MSAIDLRRLGAKVVALSMLIGLVSLSWSLVIAPLRAELAGQSDRIRETARQLARMRAILAMESDALKSGSQEAVAPYARDFLSGMQDSLITAELQSRLNAMAAARKAEVASMRVLPARVADGITYLGLRIQLRGEVKSVHELIYHVETSAPLLFVERAVLRLEERRGAVHGRSADVPILFAELDVYGGKWPGPPVSAADSAEKREPQ